jgi:hypothetical protein
VRVFTKAASGRIFPGGIVQLGVRETTLNHKYCKRASVSAAVLLGLGSLHAVAQVPPPTLELGETITVTGSADAVPSACTGFGAEVTCSNLRSAIERANGNGNEATAYDRIVLANGSVHTLTVPRVNEAIDANDNGGGDLDITTPMNIETADKLLSRATIQGAPGFNDRLLHINATVNLADLVLTKGQGVFMNGGAIYAGTRADTTITRSLITDNFASWDLDVADPNVSDPGTAALQGNGGGIYSIGPLTVSLSTLSNNLASTVAGALNNGNGGAIYASGALTLTDSTVGGAGAGNVAINGGGIQFAAGNPLTIERSTLSHNEAVSGGALNVVSLSAQPITLINSTISANRATDAGAGLNLNSDASILNTTIANNAKDVKDSSSKGSGLNQISGTVTLHNTLLANNTAIDASGAVISANCGETGTATATVASAGGNLSTDATCGLAPLTDQVVADAMIGPLALNGNLLNGNLTHALLVGSPAVDKGTLTDCPAVDERGVTRPFDALVAGTKVCDVGAFEVAVFQPPADDGGGCTTVSGKAPFDPVLPALAALGLIGLGLRRLRRD